MSRLTSSLETQFQRELATIRRRRNSTLTMHNFPDEILTGIFLLTLDPLTVEVEIISQPKNYSRQRNRLELVCTKWRTLVRSSACLWAYISSALPSRVNNRSLRYSQQHLLMCKTERETSWTRNDQFWASIKPHAQRFGSVSAFASKVILDIVGGGLESLQRLKLGGDGNRSDSSHVLASSLESPWPHLQYLVLRGISLPWSRPLVSNLAYLSLDSIVNLPLTALIQILKTSPNLGELELGSITTVVDSSSTAFGKIPLPALRRLRIHSLSGDLLNYLLDIIEPNHLDMFTLSHKPPPGDTVFSKLPKWAVDSGVDMLLKITSSFFIPVNVRIPSTGSRSPHPPTRPYRG